MPTASYLAVTGRNWARDVSGVTLAGGSWSLPLANILDPRPAIYAQASDNNPSTNTTFTVDLGVARKFELIWFAYLWAGVAGTITINIGNDATFVTNVETISDFCWPQDNSSTDNWGNSVTNGTYLGLTYEALNYPRFFVRSTSTACRYVKVAINNTSGSPPALRIGSFGISETAQFRFKYNWGMTFLDESTVTVSDSGTPYYNLRRRKRRLNIGFVPTAESDMLGKLFDFLAYKGQTEPFVILPFAETTYEARLEKVGLYGTRSSVPSFTNPFTTYYDLNLQVDEL